MIEDSRIHIGDLRPADVALLKSVAQEAAKLAVKDAFTAMGFDSERPLAAQEDMLWVRSTRERCEGIEGRAILTLIGLLVLGSVSVFLGGLKAWLPGAHP